MLAPMQLDPDENLGRSVFSRRSRDRARKGQVDIEVFLEREEAESISVDRMGHASLAELTEWSTERGQDRTPPRGFRGWAVLAVRAAEMSGRRVAATPTRENRCHADIFLNITGDERRRKQRQHANELAAHSRWLETPAGPDAS